MAFVEERMNRRTSLLGGVVLALVAAIGLAVVLLSGDDGKNDRSPTRENPQQATGESTSLKPDDVTYSDVYGAQIPSGAAGPKSTSGGRAIGFDRSPAGAVLAAINIFARAESRSGPSIFEPTITEQVVGPDRDALLEESRGSYSERSAEGIGADGTLTVAVENTRKNRSSLWAYRMDSYEATSATLNLLLRSFQGETPVYVNFAVSVRWVDNDWRLVAPLNGKFASAGQQLSEVPASYVVLGKG